MSDTNINGGGHYQPSFQNDKANISISKVMHTHTIEETTEDVILDQVVSAGDLDYYQEEYIPPASNPTLDPANPNASDQKPRTTLTPQGGYLNNVRSALENLPASLLASLGNGNAMRGLNRLIYAFNHPNANLDPQTKNILSQITQQALTKNIASLNLPSNWQPDPADSHAAEKQFAKDYNSAFESLVNQSDIPEDQANKIIYFHYHPEDMAADNPLKTLLNDFEQQALNTTAQNEGFPDGTQKPMDSAEYDAQVASDFDNAFMKHLLNDPETQELTPEEKSELETLHQFPDADVPDKAKLSDILKNLEKNALGDIKQKYGLPDGVKPGTCFTDFAAKVLGNFRGQFDSNVLNFTPPLTDAQRQLLMNTKGISPKNLPQELQAIFKTIQSNSAAQIAEMLGLPEDWLSATEKEGIGEDNVVKKALDETGEASNQEGVQSEKEIANQGINAFAKVLGKLLNTQRLATTEGVGDVYSSNYDEALNAVAMGQDAINAIKARSLQFAALSGDPNARDWLDAGSFTALISGALDKLRASIYNQQLSAGSLTQKISDMNLEIAKIKSSVQEAQKVAMNKSEDNQKRQKDWAANIENAAAALGPVAEFFAKAFVAYVRTLMWALDTVTGGLVTSICQAAGMTNLAQNVFQQMGLLTEEQAKWMDLALQVVAMVAQCLIGQPELSIKSIMSIVNDVKQLALEAVETVIKATSNVAGTVTSVGDKIANLAVSAGMAIKNGVESAVSAAMEMATDIVNGITKALKEFDALTTMLVVGDDLAKAASAAAKSISSAFKGEAKILETLEKAMGSAKEALKESLKDIKKLLKEMLTNPGEHKLAWFRLATGAKDVMQGVLEGVTHLQQGQTLLEQSKLTKLLAQFESLLTELDAQSKVINRALQQLFDSLENLISWIGDVNKQQSDTYKKLAVRFISA